jgi:polyferredoxin
MTPTSTQTPTGNPTLIRPEGRVLSTLEQDGSRHWLYPRLANGKFLKARRLVAYSLVLIFAAIPHVMIKQKPAILLDIIHRKFTLFGFTFLPTDTFLLALFGVSLLLGIFFITALFGRVWCGWACPQTVYMEFLFRPIERLCSGRAGRGGPAAANVPLFLRLLRYPLYFLACLFLAHTFLAYFVGVQELRVWVTQSPAEHPIAFAVMAATTGLMMFDFCYFREQMCIIACPYGRFQSVLLDRDSLVIGYDQSRGEPRTARRKSLTVIPPPPVLRPSALRLRLEEGRVGEGVGTEQVTNINQSHRHEPPPSPSPGVPVEVINRMVQRAGDCIDCTLCVQVCPTGIDIRQGLQIECVGCAQCIDACNDVMAKIGRPLGLIRYQSQNAMAGQKHRIVRPRLFVYLTVVAALVSALIVLIITKSPFDMTVNRNVGRPFFMTDKNLVANEFLVELTNRTDQPLDFQLTIVGDPGISIRPLGDALRLVPGQMLTEPAEIDAPPAKFQMGTLALKVRATADNGAVLEQKCEMLGPFQVPSTNPSARDTRDQQQ